MIDERVKRIIELDKEYQPLYEEIEKEIERVLEKLFGYNKNGIGNVMTDFSDTDISVSFDYTCRGYTDKEYEHFSTQFLFNDEAIDTHIEESKKRAERNKKLAEKRKLEKLEKEERKELERLMSKYGE